MDINAFFFVSFLSMITRMARIPTAPTNINVSGSFLSEITLLSISLKLSAPTNPVYPISSSSTAPTTFPTPNSCTFSLLMVVVPSVTLMLYVPSCDINFSTFFSPALMFWA